MHKTIGAWLTLATMVVLACGARADAQTKLVIGYTSLGDVGANFVAKEGGFFAKRNLDVELKALRGGSVIVPGLVVGEIQIGTLAPPVFLQAVDGGIDLTALTGLVLTKGMKSAAVVARTGVDIKSPADLVGKRTGVSGIGSSYCLCGHRVRHRRSASESGPLLRDRCYHFSLRLRRRALESVSLVEP